METNSRAKWNDIAHTAFFAVMLAAMVASPRHASARILFLAGFVYQIARINLEVNRQYGTPWWHVN